MPIITENDAAVNIEADAGLIANGYEPLAAVGKAPVAPQWTTRANTVEALAAERAAFPNAVSTGLRAGRLVPIDIDVFDPNHAERFEELARTVLGDTPLRRTGAKGCALLYRTDHPSTKLTVSTGTGGKADPKVEILGEGQQLVAFGVHPDTGKEYEWDFLDPTVISLDHLPLVTKEQRVEFARKAHALFTELGYQARPLAIGGEREPTALPEDPTVPIEKIAKALDNIPNNLDRDGWVGVGHSVHISTGGSEEGFELFDDWSKQHASYDAEATRKFWDSVHPNRSGAGYLFKLAYGVGIEPPDPFDANERYPSAEKYTGAPQVNTARQRWKTPQEDADLPPLTYFDKQNTLPCVPDGAVMVVSGAKSSHKTGLVIKKCLDAIEECGTRVLYCALEGGHGIKTARLPSAREARGMDWELLNTNWRTDNAGLNLLNDASRAALIEAHKDFKPGIVVIDVLTRAVGGEDINPPAAGQKIHNCGDALSAAFGGALVILIHHPNKNSKTGSTGSALIEDLAYAVWHVSRDGGLIKGWVEKMKDGPAEFMVNYRVDVHKTVPYIRDEKPAEKNARLPQPSELYLAVVGVLSEKPGVAVSLDDVAAELNKQGGKVQPRTLKRHIVGEKGPNGSWKTKPDLADLVARDQFGNPLTDPIMLIAGGVE
jgi:hypothetical protein